MPGSHEVFNLMSENKPSRKDDAREHLSTYLIIDNALPGFSGVLLSDQIRACVNRFSMIQPFYEEKLRPAGYELSIGDEVSTGGKRITLKDEPGKNTFALEPFDVAVIKIHETLNLPRNIIGRWNIKVGQAYRGLVWVGGPQVDPGWVGNLACPIYNLSDQTLTLELYESIAIIDFVITTPFSPDCKTYPRPPRRILFDEYNPENLRSALVTHAKAPIDRFKRELSDMQSRLSNFISITFVVLGILVAALSILVTSTQTPRVIPAWVYLNNGLAIIALATALVSLHRSRRSEGGFRWAVKRAGLYLVVSFILGATACAIVFWLIEKLK